jgi:superoxide dismutase
LDYGANREEYAKKLVNYLLNWEFILQNYKKTTQQRVLNYIKL